MNIEDIIKGTYTTNKDGSIDVDGSVWLNGNKLTEIPFKFNKVTGNFYCYDNYLTSLKNCPRWIGGGFSCWNNNLTTLDYFPDYVGNSFNCINNPNLKYEELFKIVDKVKRYIYSDYGDPDNGFITDKNKISRDRDVGEILKHEGLGSLDL